MGLIVGFVLAIMYYDGFVAREYKEKVNVAADALHRAADTIDEKNLEIYKLRKYIREELLLQKTI